ncbi:MAG: hypothetical protein L0Y68_03890 [Candidatus Dadabacteria bacterium]|nr:hypothetical protein [Candidatus Dadabacteria bacterium]
MRQVVDWSAAVWAGVISGVVFLLISMLLAYVYIGSPWVITRLIASIVMGPDVLPPPATFDATIFIVSVIINLILSIAFACILATIFHRWGLLVGIIGGALFGLALYLINFYTFSIIFPWFFLMKSWIMVISHVVFGALAGGIYEALEVEEFVPIEE